MKRRIRWPALAAILFLSVFLLILLIQQGVQGKLFYMKLFDPVSESEEYRKMDFGSNGIPEANRFGQKHDIPTGEVLALWMSASFLPVEKEKAPCSYLCFLAERGKIALFQPQAFAVRTNYISGILSDMKCFPTAGNWDEEQPGWDFDDSWGGVRTYGGERRHEGTDIMSKEDVPGIVPVVSMTDGVVEELGWLELGGYRVGVRAKSGIFYYYAHLDSYAQGLMKGTEVQAGQFLGYMGNTGYGPEGTKGMFPVHLHVGIYLPVNEGLLAVNPYWFLVYLAASNASKA